MVFGRVRVTWLVVECIDLLLQTEKIQASGLRQIHVREITATPKGINDHKSGRVARLIAILMAKAVAADHFARRDTTPFSRQATRWWPKWGWFIRRASSAGLLRAKQKAAKIMNGTVGNKGKTVPKVPSATDVKPAAR